MDERIITKEELKEEKAEADENNEEPKEEASE